jgi:hypothetical protein
LGIAIAAYIVAIYFYSSHADDPNWMLVVVAFLIFGTEMLQKADIL